MTEQEKIEMQQAELYREFRAGHYRSSYARWLGLQVIELRAREGGLQEQVDLLSEHEQQLAQNVIDLSSKDIER